jgi:hypothetical protein
MRNEVSTLSEAHSFESRKVQSLGLVSIGLYAASVLFDGVLRWALELIGAAALLYLRDGLLLVAALCGLAIARAYHLDRWQRLMSAVVAFLLVWLLWGWFNGLPVAQGLFGLKTILPIIAGLSVWVLLLDRGRLLYRYCALVAVSAFAGLAIDYFRDLPWAGLVYEVGDVSVEGQRQWTIDSVERLGGFGRASTDVAGQLVFCLAVVLFTRSANVSRVILAIICCGGIILTTSRSYLLAAILLIVVFCVLSLTKSRFLRLVLAPIPLLPVFVIWLGYEQATVTKWLQSLDRGGAFAMESAFMRMDDIWLDAVSELDDSALWVFGKGLGSIGAASKYFAPETYNPADNLLVYTLVSFGIVGSVVVFATLLRVFWLTLRSPAPSYGAFVAAVSAAGVAMSCLENPAVGLGFGLALGSAFMSYGSEERPDVSKITDRYGQPHHE